MMKERTVTANGINLSMAEAGPADAPPLILIRGLGSQRVHWPDALLQGLAGRGFRVIVFDNRDVGRSSRCPKPGTIDEPGPLTAALARGDVPAPAYPLAEMGRDVVGLMDALGIARAAVLGISMGGRILQDLLLDEAERLTGAIIVMSAARISDPAMLQGLVAWPQTREQAEQAWIDTHAAIGSPGYPMPEAAIRAEAALAWRRGTADGTDMAGAARGINRQLLAMANAPDRRDGLDRIATPCLVLHGRDDRLIPPAAAEELAALIPGARLRILPGMGHIITPALAPLIVDEVAGFLNGAA